MFAGRFTWSFKRFFFVVIMTAVLSHVVVTDWFTVNQLERKTLSDIQAENNIITDALGDMLAGFFNVPVKELFILANAYELHDDDQDAFIHALHILGESKSFDRISLVGSNGIILETWPENAYYNGLDISRNGYVEQLDDGKPYFWSNTYTEPVTGRSNIDLIVPVSGGYLLGTIDLGRLQEYISQLRTKEGAMITIVDQSGGYLAHTDQTKVIQRMKDPYMLHRQISSDGKIVDNPMITMDGKVYYPFLSKVSGTDWTIVAYYDKESYEKSISGLIRNMIIIQLMSTFFAVLVLFLSGRYFQRQTDHIMEFTRRIANGDYGFKGPDSRFAEFKELLVRFEAMAGEIGGREEEILELNNSLEDRIMERTEQLVAANGQLQEAMCDLKETQDQLVQKEKMASLGVLVAGIAHEVNTPIGVCLTTSTFLSQQGTHIREKYEKGELKNQDLRDFFEVMDESGNLMLKNLQHAGELISTFKQISQVQSPYDMELLDVKMYIRSLIGELMSRYPNIRMELIAESEEVMMTCYPSDIDLIMRNLITNAAIHGCDGRAGSRIDVFLKQIRGGCRISVADNGKGISASEIGRIFDPFYTTKRGKGGSGLGLHIIYNIITQRYQGTITCSSMEDIGTAFDMVFPGFSESNNDMGGKDVQFQE